MANILQYLTYVQSVHFRELDKRLEEKDIHQIETRKMSCPALVFFPFVYWTGDSKQQRGYCVVKFLLVIRGPLK